jgi:hypothetical protein
MVVALAHAPPPRSPLRESTRDMNELLHRLAALPGGPIVPLGILVATWVAVGFGLTLSDAGLARRRFGRGLHRFMTIPDSELDRAIEKSLHSGAFLVSAIAPALGVTAMLMAALSLGTWSREADTSLPYRQAILLGGMVAIGFSIPAFLSWSLGKLLTRSLERTFSGRTLTP